ncbi:hypothetical protein D3C84_1209690 [compost metagenome]
MVASPDSEYNEPPFMIIFPVPKGPAVGTLWIPVPVPAIPIPFCGGQPPVVPLMVVSPE